MSHFNPLSPILADLPLPIVTQRLILRPPISGDGPILCEALCETFADLKQYMPQIKGNLPTVEEVECYVRQASANWILRANHEPFLPLMMFDKESNTLVGGAGFLNFDWSKSKIEGSFWCRNEYRGQGFVQEALSACILYAFDVLQTKKFNICFDISNLAGVKIAEKLGFTKDAVIKFDNTGSGVKEIDTVIYTRSHCAGLNNQNVKYKP